MLSSLLPLLIMGLAFGLAAWLVFMWALKSGQFDDIERPKHTMLDDDDEEEPKTDAPEKEGGDDDEKGSGKS